MSLKGRFRGGRGLVHVCVVGVPFEYPAYPARKIVTNKLPNCLLSYRVQWEIPSFNKTIMFDATLDLVTEKLLYEKTVVCMKLCPPRSPQSNTIGNILNALSRRIIA
ncbi:hypothetical protein TNIN_84181 [Trichonephila inaurata madagascariensis]|uniref:Uncharacterized protein n=1 Tax=Trichonephila inaurata madagascariensis TaxID=2747483 RepID=A0A8X7C1V3_9ARAC|nr:hypothetical protein TNIN_84181 [Trichonephila inaurata madagascariensis]